MSNPHVASVPSHRQTVVVASGNRGKIAEILAVLGADRFELIPQSEFGLEEAEETGRTFVENALIKARHAAQRTGLPALADDSGLLIDVLHGAPGLITAHYGGVHGDAARNIARVLREMESVPTDQRGARFCSVMVLLEYTEDPAPRIAEGWWEGRVLEAPIGDQGFGYDPIFFDPLHGLSAAQMESALKNRISHRARALAALRAQVQARPLAAARTQA